VNGRLDPGEESTVTNKNGEYWFMDLDQGRHVVSEEMREGWQQTFPAESEYYEFEDLPVGDSYQVDDSFVTSGPAVNSVTAIGRPLHNPDGSNSSGSAFVASGGAAGGSGQELFLDSIGLEFIPSEPVNLTGRAVPVGGTFRLSLCCRL
jgi:hypothetical protein